MNKVDSFFHTLFLSLFSTCILYTPVHEILLIGSSSTIPFLFFRFFVASLSILILQSTKYKSKTVKLIIPLALLFSCLTFPITLANQLIGVIVILTLFWATLYLNDGEALDAIKLTVASILFSLVSLLFVDTYLVDFSTASFALVLECCILLIYFNLNQRGNMLQESSFRNRFLFNVILFILYLFILFFQYGIAQGFSQIISTFLRLSIHLLTLLVHLFTYGFLYLAKLVAFLLSWIPGFQNTQEDSTLDWILETGNEEALLEENFVPDNGIPQLIFQCLAVTTLLFIGFILIRKIIQTFLRVIPQTTHDSSEVRQRIQPIKKKRKSLKEIFFSKSKTNLSETRLVYKQEVEQLIQQGYPFKVGMTPLNYLSSLPQEIIDTSTITEKTEAYLAARYKENE